MLSCEGFAPALYQISDLQDLIEEFFAWFDL